jgi:hypothetical protein
MRCIRNTLLASVAVLAACGGENLEGSARQRDPERVPPIAMAERALEDIWEDLAGLGSQLPQLSDFDAARVLRTQEGEPPAATRLSLSYSRGLSGSIDFDEPRFEENGCYISVEVIFYNNEKHPELEERLVLATRGYGFFELEDSITVAMRDVVFAEANDRGAAFRRQVQRLVNNALISLSMDLDGVVIDPGEN